MNTIEIALHSPAFWSIVGTIAVQVLTTVLPSLSGMWATIVQAILAALALYLHPSEIKVAGRTGMLGSNKI